MTTASSEGQTGSDDGYVDFLASLRARFAASTASGARLFTTRAGGLFAAFLEALPADSRQSYTCSACRHFVDRFGGLVKIGPDGTTSSILWDPSGVPAFFRDSVGALSRLVTRAPVDGVFLSADEVWGTPSNVSNKLGRSWHHMSVTPESALVFKPGVILSVSQVRAEKLSDHGMLGRGLEEFPVEIVRQAHTLLTTGALYRSEKCIGVARWLLDLHEARAASRTALGRDNVTWLAVASAPTGFCHVRSSMIGTLLEDIVAGMPFAEIKRRFDDKMDPLKYQRPTALPSDGNVAQAEAIVQKLASAGALARRFARLDDIQTLWTPQPPAPAASGGGGVFAHLETRETRTAPEVELPPVTMTWEKFARTVLPDALAIEFHVPAVPASYCAMVTAVNPDAPPILQWDSEARRNPVSWYFYVRGSRPQDWNLAPNTFHEVTAVSLQPTMWGPSASFAHQGEKVFFILKGARDLVYKTGCGYFPEMLRSEYHAVRKTMEAYARAAVVTGGESASACGIGLQKGGGTWNRQFRVTTKGMRVTYTLDRWD